MARRKSGCITSAAVRSRLQSILSEFFMGGGEGLRYLYRIVPAYRQGNHLLAELPFAIVDQ